MLNEFKEDMMKTFEMTNLGLMKYFLGIEIKQQEEGIFISQKKYTESLIKRFKTNGYNSGNPIRQKQSIPKRCL